jgi:hypothetical protein
MKNVITFLFVFLTLSFISPFPVAYGEMPGGEERESQKYDESSYELMSYSDESWYQFGESTTNSIASSLKEFMWMVNLITAQVVLMIVYQMFSLDIVEVTIEAVRGISSSIAGGLLSTFGTFALAIFSIGIIVKAYIQQNWQAFVKLVSLVIISLALLFSISSERFDYVSFANTLSIEIENMIMNVNPSLTGESDFDPTNMSSTAVALENKVFDALIYKPYLLLQYGTTDESVILAEDPERITAYLEADPRTEEGIQVREDIAQVEYEDYENYNIFAGAGFKQTGYILVMFLSTIVQGVVYFFISLLRIMLQFGFIVMLLLAPFAIFLSIFPSFETVVGRYARTLGLLVLFKAITMFFILVSVSFISLGYDMTNTTDDLYYRIFMQIIMSVAIIFLYAKRQAVMNMIEGASLNVDDMGGGALPRLGGREKIHRGLRKIGHKTANKGKALGEKIRRGSEASTGAIKKAGTNLGEKSKNVTSMTGRKIKNANERVKTASGRFAEYQRGESSEGNIYEGNSGERAAAKEIAATSERQSNSRISKEKQSTTTHLRGESPSGDHDPSVSQSQQQVTKGQKTNLTSASPKRKASSRTASTLEKNNQSTKEKATSTNGSTSRKASVGKSQSLNTSKTNQVKQKTHQTEQRQASPQREVKTNEVKPKEERNGRLGQTSRLNQRAE